MKKPAYAVIPDGVDMNYVRKLTKGVKYKIKEIYTGSNRGVGFYIDNDSGVDIYCLENKCAHLGDQNWELIYE